MTRIGKEISIKFKLQRFDDLASFPPKGSLDNLYIADDTGILYQWDGDSYEEIKASSSGAGTPYEPNVVVKSFLNNPYAVAADEVVLCDMSNGNVIVDFPTAATNKNKIITVKKVGASPNRVIMNAFGVELLEGLSSITIRARNNSYSFISDGQNWFVI